MLQNALVRVLLKRFQHNFVISFTTKDTNSCKQARIKKRIQTLFIVFPNLFLGKNRHFVLVHLVERLRHRDDILRHLTRLRSRYREHFQMTRKQLQRYAPISRLATRVKRVCLVSF